MILILFIVFLAVGLMCFVYLIENRYSDLAAVISITSLIFSLTLLVIMLIRIADISYATEENREEGIRWAKEIGNIKSEVLRVETVKKIKKYNAHLEAKQDLNTNFLFDLLIDEEITNLKPISVPNE
jgi:energy-converting hydrogenase Eha subunit C